MAEDFKKEKNEKPRKNRLVRFFAIASAGAACAVVFSVLFDTACIIKYITGIPCPSCGITRAHIEFFKLDFAGAFAMHPLFLYSVIAAGLGALVFFKPAAADSKIFNVVVWALIIVFIAVYIVRMILFYPHTPPMDSKGDSLFGLIASWFK